MTECSLQCLMMTPNTGLPPASAVTGSCYCTKTNSKIRECSHFQKAIAGIYTVHASLDCDVCAVFTVIYKWNPHVEMFHKLLLKGGDSKLHPVWFALCTNLWSLLSSLWCIAHCVHQILRWQDMAVYTERSGFWQAGIHRNNISWYQGIHSGFSAAVTEYQIQAFSFSLCTGEGDMFFSFWLSKACCFCQPGYWSVCFLSNFCGAVRRAAIAGMLFKLIVADRQQILSGDLRETQSCIVRDGFGAGLGQSDRDREKQSIARTFFSEDKGVYSLYKGLKNWQKKEAYNVARSQTQTHNARGCWFDSKWQRTNGKREC